MRSRSVTYANRRERTSVIGAMRPILETRRLKLREFNQDDLDDLAAMVADEDQMTFYPRPKTRAEASAWISRNLALYKEYGFRLLAYRGSPDFRLPWVLRDPTARSRGRFGNRDRIATRKTFWNRGIATDAAMAAQDLAF
jgi:RimJ/RimL family protein N-acetyltransferase